MATEEDLIDYSDEEIQPDTNTKTTNGSAGKTDGATATKGSYVGIHSSSFNDLLLKPELLKAIIDCGFEHPSDVQQLVIPQAIVGTDVICQAKSGLGKTAVFVISTIQQVDPVPGEASILVMCHTRELAFQIKNEYARFTKYLPEIRTSVFYGGRDIKEDEKVLADKANYPTVIVATPGRLNALVRDKGLRLNGIKFFVLDECDKMLESIDMRRDVQEIFKATPQVKQVLMFSATLVPNVRAICKRFMRTPLEIYVDDEANLQLQGLKLYYIKLEESEKNRHLNDILDKLQFNQVIIFVKSVARATELGKLLQECNFPVVVVHSGLQQAERIERYKAFKEFKKRICVATDVFGRGVDFERVNVAINYDMPEERGNASDKKVGVNEPNTDLVTSAAGTYLHRVGRAGRFGTKGIAISFIATEHDEAVLARVKDRLGDVVIEEFPKDPSELEKVGGLE